MKKSIETSNLHRRIALVIIRRLGSSRPRIILGFMVATAGLSMWIANVSTALMMLPIALAIIRKEREISPDSGQSNFGIALMLAIAYAASIGGPGTLIGTTPNLVFVGVLKNLYPEAPEITFFQWMMIGVPLVIIFIPVIWLYICRLFAIRGSLPGASSVIKQELSALGRMTTAEKRVLAVVSCAALGWIFRNDFHFGFFVVPGWASLLGVQDYAHDATVAITAALLMFILPAGPKGSNVQTENGRLLDWNAAKTVPWGIILLVGGGYAIANSFSSTGLAGWLGQELTFLSVLPIFVVLLLVVLFTTFITEISSNTATATIFLPILGGIAVAGQAHPLLLMIPATIACSFAFMLPSATGPNAVIFASGWVTIPRMAFTGFFLNIISVVLVTAIMYLLVVPLFGLSQSLPAWAQ